MQLQVEAAVGVEVDSTVAEVVRNTVVAVVAADRNTAAGVVVAHNTVAEVDHSKVVAVVRSKVAEADRNTAAGVVAVVEAVDSRFVVADPESRRFDCCHWCRS